ncbi:MAG: hypothetical protein Fur006_29950 [Coleofasciculaceae cyanobacterium]
MEQGDRLLQYPSGYSYIELHLLVGLKRTTEALQNTEVRERESYTNDMQLGISYE